MLELFTALLLVWKVPLGLLPVQVWTNVILIGVTWISTATLQVPNHMKLARGFDSKLHNILVSSNWIRTVAWSIRGAIIIWMLQTLLPA
jgi:hypothetical protein